MIEEKGHIQEVGVLENLGLSQGIAMEIGLMAVPKTEGITKMVNISRNTPIFVGETIALNHIVKMIQ